MIIADVLNVVIIHILRNKNKSHRLNNKNVKLSEKYQCVENIRVLEHLRIQSYIALFFGFITPLLSIVRYVFNDYYLSRSVFHLVSFKSRNLRLSKIFQDYNLYTIVLTIFWGYKSPRLRYRINMLKRKNHSKISANNFVLNNFNDKLITRHTTEEHIQYLKSAWRWMMERDDEIGDIIHDVFNFCSNLS